MGEILSLSLRPKTFADLVGQKSTVQAIMAQMESKRFPRTWMFHGASGTGKTTIARILALSLQCKKPEDGVFGAPSLSMWERQGDYAIYEINASSVNGVEALSRIAEESTFLPSPPSLQRVYILDEAQRISDAAQNLLLKHFEDPPKTTTWIVCTTHPQKLIPTLRRRCFSLAIPNLSDAGINLLLKRAAKTIGLTRKLEPLKEQLDIAGISSPALVLMAVERYAGGASPSASIRTGDTELDSLRICRSFVRGDWPTIKAELKLASPEDARVIRLSVMGYLRAIFLSDSPSIPASRLAATICALATPGPIEDPAYLAWVCATLYTECKKYKTA